jgi:hypothetical protein
MNLLFSFMENKILFLHGLNSKPWQDRVDILESAGVKVFAPHIIYGQQDEVTIARGIIEKERITHLVGHSLGGILCYYLSNLYNIPTLMFNPAFCFSNKHYFENFRGLSSLESFEKQYALDLLKKQFAVVGMCDDVVLPAAQISGLSGATIYKIPDLGHKISPDIFKKYFDIFTKEANINATI